MRKIEDVKNDIQKINYVLKSFKNTKREIYEFEMTKRDLCRELFYLREKEKEEKND